MTQLHETQADDENEGWELWSTDELESDLARVEARRGLFPDSADDDSQRGVSLGRYEVLRRIGRGGMGTVFLARDPALARNVAIKVLHSAASDSEPDRATKRRRIQREATALAQLTHPQVVRVYDVGEERGHTYIAMEYVSGGTLRDWREYTRPRPDLASILRTYAKAGRGLAAAHASGLLHRDFKPDNVLVASDGRVLVSDFGLVRAASLPDEALSSREELSELTEDVTRTGAVLGTPGYMAPEVFAGRPAEAAADQFAFCVSLFETLVGRRPFAGRFKPARAPWSTFALAESTPLRQMPRWLRRLLIRGLEPNPRARHPDMDALLRTLERGRTTRRRRRTWWVASLGSAAVIGAFAGLSSAPPRVEHPLCSSDAPRASAVPSEQRKSIEAAFSASGLRNPDQAAAKILKHLDDRTQRWARELSEACTPEIERSAVRRGHKLDCLQAERHELTALTAALEAIDAETAGTGVEFVVGRAPALSCADDRALRGRVTPPSAPQLARAVEHHRGDLARGSMLVSVGELDQARTIAQGARASAAAAAFAPLALEADFLAARILWKAKRRTQALVALRALELEAESQGHDRVALGASVLHLELLVHEARPPMEFQARLDHARARARRLGDDVALINLEFTHAQHQQRIGHHQRALSVATAALELARDRLGAEHPEVAYAHDYVSGALTSLHRYEAALEHKRAAISTLEGAYGHGSIAVSVLLNTAGAVARHAGEHALAQHWHTRSIAIVEARLGLDSPRLTTSLAAAAVSAQARGDAQETLRLLDRQLALEDREGIVSHTARRRRIDALILGGQLESAAIAYQEATQALASAGLNAPVWDHADTLRAGAQLALLKGNWDTAVSRASQAVEASRTYPPSGVYPLIVLAQAQLAAGNLDDAAAVLERASQLGDGSVTTLPWPLAELRATQLDLARATNSPDIEEKRALALASVRRALGRHHPLRIAVETSAD
ncbi:MAG: serine/threonine-protein kinase [Nannocystaceae bacterium]|nr:serine/threonine-protein kinase [Nannocystaceae bacterium]